ncbi:MAG: hypothetical protein CO001_03925 [Candidatus Portnoybacteria bacterium CG_4_8_14_3_um_filter_40_10]|uniref:Radical SAM core domain-containing protein n=1 Tax=Candidatus Portnoybacteria bacterium CG_4_8_14_3_um_filter_40_10 TaxID=1974801 RepID=A0A2M7IHF9_9BACT|nr:MAG: hypothetical protein CO001_03925 [Candidatus Portnoybacteria bacterium CG_4_8_14_3_um_filter_40_10]
MRIASVRRYAANLIDKNFGSSLSRPAYIDLIITKKCNFRCGHCDTWKSNNIYQMPPERWFGLLAQISQAWPEAVVEISGGEPLIEKYLSLKIANLGSRLALAMSLNTNGALINEQTAADISRSGFASVKVSLYSLDESIHDKLRGVSGAGAKAKKALRHLKDKNRKNEIKIEVGLLLTGLNIEGISDLVLYCQENNFNLIIQPLDFNIERFYRENWYSSSELWPTKEQVEKYLKPIIKNKPPVIKNPSFHLKLIYRYYLDGNSLGRRPCLAPYNNLIIEPNGDVKLCFRSQPIGNIGENNIQGIWQGKKAKEERQRLRFCQKSCKIIGCNMRKQLKDLL